MSEKKGVAECRAPEEEAAVGNPRSVDPREQFERSLSADEWYDYMGLE